MKAVPLENYEEMISKAWASDQPLLDKYHYCAGEGLESCVTDTLTRLKSCKDLQFFKVILDGAEIGFFATEYFRFGSFLTTFFIFPEFRSKKNGKDFISLVRKHCGYDKCLFTAIFDNNERAAIFLEKNGFDIIEIGTEGHRQYYVYKYEK